MQAFCYNSVSKQLLDIAIMFKQQLEQSGLKHVYQWYANAMRRRRPDSELSYESFVNHFHYNDYGNSCFIFGNYKLGFILGHTANGFYIPSHFAPRTMKGGLKLLSLLAKHNIVLAITDDLSKTLEKTNYYHFTDIIIPSYFRGTLTNKYIWCSCPLATIGLKTLYVRCVIENSFTDIFNFSWDDIIDGVPNFSDCDSFSYPHMDFEFIQKSPFNLTNTYL